MKSFWVEIEILGPCPLSLRFFSQTVPFFERIELNLSLITIVYHIHIFFICSSSVQYRIQLEEFGFAASW